MRAHVKTPQRTKDGLILYQNRVVDGFHCGCKPFREKGDIDPILKDSKWVEMTHRRKLNSAPGMYTSVNAKR